MIWCFTTAEVYEPKGYSETLELLDKFKYNITTLIFVDPSEIDNSLDQEQGEPEDDNSGFFDNLISSIKSVFSSDERSIGDLIKELSKEGVLIQVNVTNPNLAPVKEMYNIQSIPYIVILKGNKILYRDIATHKAAEKVANIKKLINEENKQKDKNETKQQSSSQLITISPDKASFQAVKQSDLYFNVTQSSNTTQPNQSVTVLPPKRGINDTQLTPTSTVAYNKANSKSYQSQAGSQNTTGNLNQINVPSGIKSTNNVDKNATNLVITPSLNKTDNIAPISANSTVYRQPQVIYDNNTRFDNDWKSLLKEEEETVERIQSIYNNEQKLSQSIDESDQDYHESEELFYQAKNAIDKSLQESEKQMKQYEMELDRLYNARKETIKARENLYHQCENCVGTRDGIVQQRINGQYAPIRTPYTSMSSNQNNFHDLMKDTPNVSYSNVKRGT